MSKELVERLRYGYLVNERTGDVDEGRTDALFDEAADEIERINGIIEDAVQACRVLSHSTEQIMSNPPLNGAAYCVLKILSKAHKVKE